MILSLLAFVAAQAADPAEARLRACLAEAQSDPAAAAETASAWRAEGGGLLAQQCLGLALVEQERWADAAAQYEEAARAAEASVDPRHADFWVQAGNAWLAAGDGARARDAIDAALATSLLSDALRGEAHLDRARALVALGDEAAARADLDRALELVPEDPFAWYLSAALAQRTGDLARASADIARARDLAPDSPDVLLLAGTIAGLGGDMAEAERLYRRVAELAPETAAGRQARAALPPAEPVTPGPPPRPEGR